MDRFNNSVRPQTRSQSQSIMDAEILRCDSDSDIVSMPALSSASSIGLDTESNASRSQVIAQSPVAVQNTLDPNLSLPYDYQCSEDEIDSAFSTAQCIATDSRPSVTTDARPSPDPPPYEDLDAGRIDGTADTPNFDSDTDIVDSLLNKPKEDFTLRDLLLVMKKTMVK